MGPRARWVIYGLLLALSMFFGKDFAIVVGSALNAAGLPSTSTSQSANPN